MATLYIAVPAFYTAMDAFYFAMAVFYIAVATIYTAMAIGHSTEHSNQLCSQKVSSPVFSGPELIHILF